MYKVLYRKWRPQRFSDVIGQPHITMTLKNELASGRISHAYLFTGSRGTGKTTCAKILAKAINCLNLQDLDPCGKCEVCKGIENNSILDIVEIDAASNNGVENIRNLREEASFTPTACKYRVYIIDEVHMLSIGAFNALLKTLEEPPEHVVFILATTEIYKLPSTILSRCQRFDFHRINPYDIADRIKFIANKENVKIDDAAALLIAKFSDGAMRDAISLLDQCMSKNNDISVNVVREASGLADSEQLLHLTDYICKKNASEALNVVNNLYSLSKDMVRLCEELIDYFRNMMIIKTAENCENIVLSIGENLVKLKEQSNLLELDHIIYIMDSLQYALSNMFKGVNKQVEMEVTIIKLCTKIRGISLEYLDARINNLEKSINLCKIKSNAEINKMDIENKLESDFIKENDQKFNKKEIINNKNFQSNNTLDTKILENNEEVLNQSLVKMKEWPEVLKTLKSYSQVVGTAFKNSTAYISGGYVLIDAPNSMAFELLKKPSQREKMRLAIKEVTGTVYKLGPYKSMNVSKETDDIDYLNKLVNFAEKAGISVKRI